MLLHRHAAGAVLLVLSLVAGLGMARLDYQDNPRDLYLRSGPESDRLDHLYATFGADDNTVLILVEDTQGVFRLPTLQAIDRLQRQLEQDPAVADVRSLLDLRRQRVPLPLIDLRDSDDRRVAEAKQEALRHPLARGILLSEDGEATVLTVRLAGQSLSIAQLQASVSRLKADLAELQRPATSRLLLSGPPIIRVESLAQLRVDQIKFSLLGGFASLVIAVAIFRQWHAVLVGLLGPAIGVFWTLGAMGWMGQRLDGIKIIIPTLLFVIGFTDSLHLIMGFGRRSAPPGGWIARARGTLRELGGACLMTSLTTAVGFGSLMLSGTASIQRFGFCCAVGAMILFVAVTTTFFWCMSGWLGQRVATAKPFRRRVPKRSRLLGRLVRLLRYPRAITAISIVACLAMGAAAATLKPNIFWTESVSRSSPTMEAIEVMNRHFGGTTYAAVLVGWSPEQTVASPPVVKAMAAAHRVIREEPHFGKPLSIANVLASLDYPGGSFARRWSRYSAQVDPDEAPQRLVHREQREAVIYFLTADAGAAELEPAMLRAQRRLAEISAATGVKLELSGTPLVAGRVFTTMIRELAISLAVASLLVFMIIALPLQSIRLGLASIVPNAFPLLVAGATIKLTSGYLTLTNTLTFCLCLGIAVDDTIHFLMAYRERLRQGASVVTAVVSSLHRVGRVLLLSSLILVVGMAAMLSSDVPPLRIFSMLAMLAIGSALVGDLVLLPALLLLLGRPSRIAAPPREAASAARR